MSIEITRVRTVKILPYIEPYLSFTDPKNKEPFLEEFVQYMTQAPEMMMVIAALELEDPEVPVRAFAIAQNPGFKVPHINLAQTWSHPENPWEIPREMFSRIVMWAVSLGKTSIRGQTQRSTTALYRKWGFQPVSQIIQFDLDTVQSNLASQMKEAIPDGEST